MKKNYILTFFLSTTIIFNPSFAQVVIEWQNTMGGNNQDYLHSISQTADGGYICGGESWSNISADKTENSQGLADYWVVKLDAVGNIQWQNTIGGDSSDFLRSISQTTDGGYICGGYSMSNISGDKTESCMGSWDYWIVKLDATGNIQWQNTIGGIFSDSLLRISQTIDGGYICGGPSQSPASGDKTENSMGGSDYWVVKLDAAGNIQWQNTIGGNSGDYLYSVSQTTDGGYICGGYSMSNISGDKTENCLGYYDYWVVKLDASGNIQWQNTIGGSNADDMYSLAATMDGGCICGGMSMSNISGDKTENSMGPPNTPDYWVVKLDASGNIQWQNTIGGSNYEILKSIVPTIDGGFVCGGYSNSNISGDKIENSLGGYDYWLVKLDAAGNIQWQNTIGGTLDDRLRSLFQTADGSYIFGGNSNSIISGDKTENCLGGDDYWVVKLTEHYNSITGNLFLDLNSNSVQDTGEPGISNRRMDETITGAFSFSGQSGVYYIVIADTGNFSVAPLSINNFSAIPAQHSAYFSTLDLIDSLNHFAFQPTATINDLCVSITPPPIFRVGWNCTYQIHYVNEGTTILSPTIIFRKNSFLSYVTSSVAPAGITSDSIVWNLPSLSPLQQGTISVTLNVIIGTPIGTPVVCYARIEPIIGDANPYCNLGGWEPPLSVTAPYDPNEIVVNRDTLSLSELPSTYLQYIIYFQNTGNDTAFAVRVEDVLPVSLDASTMELIGMSHAGNIQYDPLMRKVIFRFDNILLPDSNVNEAASHGYIHYRIKPVTTLIAGDIIQNQAGIFFDFNAPVMTNTAQTHIVLITEAEEYEDNNSVLIYPNPARDELVVRSKGFGDKAEITIYNVIGDILFSQKLKASRQQQVLDVSALPRGIYFIKVHLEEKIVLRKIVLM